jgi:hypothetical protein
MLSLLPSLGSSLFLVALVLYGVSGAGAFTSSLTIQSRCPSSFRLDSTSEDASNNNDVSLSTILTSRLPTSVDDSVRQAAEALKRATINGVHRHSVRLLLPVIGATELDDWPGGARQMMEAANPLVQQILKLVYQNDNQLELNNVLLDANDGVCAIMGQASTSAKDDSCTVLLPSGDTVTQLQELERQVGPKRNLILVNPQWKRQSDLGGFFGQKDKDKVAFAETFVPTFSLTNMICEGDSIRVLRTYPGPWRVFVRKEDATGVVDWVQIGSKLVVAERPSDWDLLPANQQDGGRLFDYGQPTYTEINDMLISTPSYLPKSPAERAQAAFNFIKDTL